MDRHSALLLFTILWVLVAPLIMLLRWKSQNEGVGLTLAYLLHLSMLHFPGAAIYLLPWYSYRNASTVIDGFGESLIALVSFGVGSIIVAPGLRQLFKLDVAKGISRAPDARLPQLYIWVGFISYFVLSPLLGGIPTVAALISAGWNLTVVGIGLACWKAMRLNKTKDLRRWLLCAMALPFFTIVSQGFLGYGVVALLAIFSLIATFYRRRVKLIVITVFVAYLGLSFYCAYMRDRIMIREVVWGGGGVVARVESVVGTLGSVEWFNPYNTNQLRLIDERLNQNFLVGASMQYLASGARGFANGATLYQAMLALVPRFIWWGKPMVAGGMGIVSEYTGIFFLESTSVGIGQVMEFYINFGTLGVIFGFLILGGVIGAVDTIARHRLLGGDLHGFALWYLPGLSFLQVGGSLVEVASSFGAAVVTASLVNRILRRWRGSRLKVSVGLFEPANEISIGTMDKPPRIPGVRR